MKLRYCGNAACEQTLGVMDAEGAYCQKCGQALLPWVQCRCRRGFFNPRMIQLGLTKYCGFCGKALTPEYLAQGQSVPYLTTPTVQSPLTTQRA